MFHYRDGRFIFTRIRDPTIGKDRRILILALDMSKNKVPTSVLITKNEVTVLEWNKPKMRNIIIWNIGKIFVPLFSPFWTWIHIRSKKFFNKGQGFFVIVRMNKQIYHCVLCISLFMVTIIAPYAQIRPQGRFCT